MEATKVPSSEGASFDKSPTVRPRANVLGIGIDAVDMPSAVGRILHAVARRRKGYVCVTGVHGIMESQSDATLAQTINGSLLTVPDGMPTVWIGRAQRHSRMRQVRGADLMLEVCRGGVAAGVRHYFFGGNVGVADDLRRALTSRIPGLQVVGTFTPPYRPLNEEEASQLAQDIEASRADIVWVGLSTPKQERFMAASHRRLACSVMIGVGAAFDMHTGRTTQAPNWMRAVGLEWFYRLVTEPRRLWKRYLKNNPAFVIRVAQQWLRPSRYPAPS